MEDCGSWVHEEWQTPPPGCRQVADATRPGRQRRRTETGPAWHHPRSTEGGSISNALRPRYRYMSTYHTGWITVHARSGGISESVEKIGRVSVCLRAFPNGDGGSNTVGSTCSRLHHKGKREFVVWSSRIRFSPSRAPLARVPWGTDTLNLCSSFE